MRLSVTDPKISILGESIVALWAGSNHDKEQALARFRATSCDGNPSFEASASRMYTAIAEARRDHLEDFCLKRTLGIDWQAFQKAALESPTKIVEDLYAKMSQFSLNLEMILAGIDQDGAHIHHINDKSNISGSEFGVMGVGTGAEQALVSLAWRGHKKACSLAKGIYNVFEAKKSSEMAQGVGTATDIVLIRDGHPARFLAPRALAKLKEIYKSIRPPALSSKHEAVIEKLIQTR